VHNFVAVNHVCSFTLKMHQEHVFGRRGSARTSRATLSQTPVRWGAGGHPSPCPFPSTLSASRSRRLRPQVLYIPGDATDASVQRTDSERWRCRCRVDVGHVSTNNSLTLLTHSVHGGHIAGAAHCPGSRPTLERRRLK